MMRLPAIVSILAVQLLAAPGSADEREGLPALAAPFVIVENGGTATQKEIDAVAAGVNTPLIDGLSLVTRLPLVEPPPKTAADALSTALSEGEDLFFTGALEAANYYFEKATDIAAKYPALLAFHPHLREILFKSYIYMAQIGRQAEGEAAATAYLKKAAAMAGAAPAPEEFPPWVCDTFSAIRRVQQGSYGTVVMSAPKTCRLFIDGRDLGIGARFVDLPVGSTYVRAVCDGTESAVTRLEVNAGAQTAYAPLLMKTGALHIVDHRLRLHVYETSDHAALLSDLSAIGAHFDVDRMVVLEMAHGGLTTSILDVANRKMVRHVTHERKMGPSAMTAEAATLVKSDHPISPPVSPISNRPWYEDVPGWVTSGLGLAALGAGAALRISAEPDTMLKPISYAMLAGGAGLLTSGIILLVLPPVSVNNDIPKMTGGLTVSVSGRF